MSAKKYFSIFLMIIFINIIITFHVYADENNNTNEIANQNDNSSVIANNQISEETQATPNEDRINDLENQKNDLSEQTNKTNTQLEIVQSELGNTVAEITELSQRIFDKQTELEEYEKKIEILNQEIENINNEKKDAEEEYENQKKMAEKRLVSMYEMGSMSYLDFLLSSKKLSDFISRYYYISLIAEADNSLLKTVEDKKKNIENYAEKLQNNKNELKKYEDNLKKEKIALSNYIIVKNQKLANLNSDEAKLQKEIEEYQSQIQQIESEIKILTLSSAGADYVGGTFSWPVPGYTNITSSFGMRTHPITGIYKLHTGMDIGAPYGANFIAANDGVVIKAGYNTAYGNMVILDHGGGITTLYAHGSEILVNIR